jgi:alkylated DNA repair dioxygenase AlkB
VRAAAALQHRCETAVRFAAHPVRLFGRTMQTPRETAFLAPVGVRYRYSGHEHEGEGVPDWLRAMVAAVADRSRADFVSVLATRYRSGRDHVGWHADDERELGVDPVIAVLSLGAERDLCFRPASPVATERWRVPLAAGDLLVMGPGVQRRFRHALPARSGVGPRISLSFRPAMDVGP